MKNAVFWDMELCRYCVNLKVVVFTQDLHGTTSQKTDDSLQISGSAKEEHFLRIGATINSSKKHPLHEVTQLCMYTKIVF
jgi:hypothetical protein